MSRITNYKKNLYNFIKIKLNEDKNNNNYYSPIIFLSIYNINNKEKINNNYNMKYYFAYSLLIMEEIIKLEKNNFDNYQKIFYGFLKGLESLSSNNFIKKEITNIINICFTKKYFKDKYYFEFNNNKVNIKELNLNDKFLENKLNNFKIINKKNLINYIYQTYGYIMKNSLILGFIKKTLNKNDINIINEISLSLSLFIKISNDYKNLIEDIEKSKNYTTNIIINLGVEESFTLFNKEKINLIKNCLKINIYTTTIKELIKNIDFDFNICLENAIL